MKRGRILLNREEVRLTGPAQALRHGIGFLPSERKAEGLATLLSVLDNIVMASLTFVSWLGGILVGGRMKRVAREFVDKLNIKVAGLHQKAGNLSGGNQQKVVLAKVLARGSKILVFDEPTRGIDVATRREIYGLMDSLAASGTSIVVSSSDLPELQQTCDRILVMYKGRQVAEFEGNVGKEELLRAVLGQMSDGGVLSPTAETEVLSETAAKAAAAKAVEAKAVEARAVEARAAARRRSSEGMSQALGVPLFAAILIIFFALGNDRFLSKVNILNLSRQLAILLVLSAAQTFAIITRGVDMSIGAMAAAASMGLGLAWLATHNMILAIVVGLLTGMVGGLLNAVLIGGLNVDPFITTLGAMYVGRGAALLVTDGQPIFGFPTWFAYIADGMIGPIPFLVILAIIVAILCQLVLTRTRFGRQLAAVGGNIDGAKVSGVNVGRSTGMGYVLSAFLAGVAGVIMTSCFFSAQPNVGTSAHLDGITAAIIGGISLDGGRGDIIGVAMGVLVLGILTNGMNVMGITAFIQLMVMGLVLIVSLIVDRLRVVAREKRLAAE